MPLRTKTRKVFTLEGLERLLIEHDAAGTGSRARVTCIIVDLARSAGWPACEIDVRPRR